MKRKFLVVKEWIESGELHGTNERAILCECADLLDDANATEILGGGIIFKATNGKHYTVTVEAVISEVNPKLVQAILDDREYEKELEEAEDYKAQKRAGSWCVWLVHSNSD